MVTVQDGKQFWTVPYTGTYQITAVGAPEGYDTYSSVVRGRGAYMRGEFELSKSDVIKILVAQQGSVNTQYKASGGGGGSFFATSSNSPLIVSGGCGGIENLDTRLVNCDASTRTFGRENQCLHSCAIWSGGVNGSVALEADTDNSGGGGGGLYSDRRSNSNFGVVCGNGGEGSKAFPQGGAGGRAWYNNADERFGSGGGAYGSVGGAKGGYSGGGSYNIGENQVKKEGYLENGHGYVEIKRIA